MKQFEKKLKEQLYAHETPLDTNALFDGLQPHLPKTKSVLWKWPLPALCVLVVLAIYWDINTKKEEQYIEKEDKEAKTINKEAINKQKEAIAIGELAKKEDEEPVIINKETINKDKEAILIVKSIKKQKKEDKNINKEAIAINQLGKKQLIDTNFIKTQTNNMDEQSILFDIEAKEGEGVKINIENEDFENEIQNKTLGISIKMQDVNLFEQNKYKPINELPIIAQQLPMPLFEHSFKKQYIAGRGPNFQIGIGAHLGIGYALKTLKVKADAPDTAESYLINREDSEKSLETLGAGLDLYLKHAKGAYLRTGISGGRMAEKFETSFSITETFIDPNGIIEIIIEPNGDTTIVRGPVPVTRTTSYEKRKYNRLTFYDLPLILGYEFDGAPWHFGLEAGAHINLAFASEGEMFGPTGGIIDMKAQRNDVFKPSMGASLYLGLRASYDLGDRLQLTFAPHLRHFPKSLTVGSYPLEQRYTLLGFDAGIRFMFNAGSGKASCYRF